MDFSILFVCFLILVTGACIGSFLNVVALRAISKESIVFPSSKCPKCNEPIKWYDNIPVFSYLFTFKGKCRNCGCKVSLQYPIVEALTAIIFLGSVIAFGLTLKTLLLLIISCISIVIIITDLKEHSTFDVHLWVLIISCIAASLYFNGIYNYTIPFIGLLVGVIVMELIARLGYYLIIKNNETEEKTDVSEDVKQTENTQEESKTEEVSDEEITDINEYVKKKKRVFGEGDTYIAAAAGALLGWKYLIVALAFSVIFQAICILPKSLSRLFKQKEYKFIISFGLFLLSAIITYCLHRIYLFHNTSIILECAIYIFIAIDAILGIYAIGRLRSLVDKQDAVVDDEFGFFDIPFGPALLISMFVTFFFGKYLTSFIVKNIFLMVM